MRIRQQTTGCFFALALLACTPAFAGCPTINGEFETTTQQLDGTTITTTFKLFTKVDGGSHCYRIGSVKEFIAADGKPHYLEQEGQRGHLTFTCDGDSLEIVAEPAGLARFEMSVTADGEDGISISSDTPALFGVYKRISQSPTPSPLSGD